MQARGEGHTPATSPGSRCRCTPGSRPCAVRVNPSPLRGPSLPCLSVPGRSSSAPSPSVPRHRPPARLRHVTRVPARLPAARRSLGSILRPNPGTGQGGGRGGSCLPTSVGKTATRSPKEKFRAISESDRWIFLPPPPPPGIPAFTAASLCAAVNAKSESAERRATELRRRESKRAQKEEKGKKSVAAAGC